MQILVWEVIDDIFVVIKGTLSISKMSVEAHKNNKYLITIWLLRIRFVLITKNINL